MDRKKLKARILSSDSDAIVMEIEVEKGTTIPRVGNAVLVTAPSTRKVVAGGRRLNQKRALLDMVARGTVTRVEGTKVTVQNRFGSVKIPPSRIGTIISNNEIVNVREITSEIRPALSVVR